MRFLRLAPCWLGFHLMPLGLNYDLSWTWVCASCGRIRPGALQRRRR